MEKSHTTIKTSFKNIIIDEYIEDKIKKAVTNVNKIVILTNQFLNAYLLDRFYKKKKFPPINRTLIRYAQEMVTERFNKNRETNKLRENMKDYFDIHFNKCVFIEEDIISRSHLTKCLSYEEINIITDIKNNVTQHFFQYIDKAVNLTFNTREYYFRIKNDKKLSDDEKTIKIKKMNDVIKQIKTDISMFHKPCSSPSKYHKFIKEIRKNIIPKDRKKKIALTKEYPLAYDIKVSPFSYLHSMFYLNDLIYEKNEKNEKEHKKGINYKKVKLFQVIPQRTNIIPCHITIDSPALSELSWGKKEYMEFRTASKKKTPDEDLKRLWSLAFDLDDRVFKDKKIFKFAYMITTNGYDVSVLFERKNENEKLFTKKEKEILEKGKYLSKVKIKPWMKKRKLIAIDPNLGDLNHCAMYIDGEKKTGKKKNYLIEERYTRGQRNRDMDVTKFSKQMNDFKNQTIIAKKTVTEHEREFSQKYDSKSPKDFLKYCKEKNNLNRTLFDHYSDEFYRKTKWYRYINTQKSENKFMKRFEKSFGKPDECLVVYGDWSKDQAQKGNEPGISKRMRKVIKNYGYPLYLINEYKTSITCHKCHGKNENNFHEHVKKSVQKKLDKELIPKKVERKNYCGMKKVKKKKKEKKVLAKKSKVWGLQRCTNVKCKTYHNRDSNACMNMLNIAISILKGLGIPELFKPPKKSKLTTAIT